MFDPRQKLGLWLGGVISIVGCIALAMQPPIPQPLDYHNFADTKMMFGIPNFWNVMSNLPFLLVGLLGLYKLSVSKTLNVNASFYWAYFLFFFGVSCVALGSGYYHVFPSNSTLVWDRLPMTIAFMALFPLIVAEFVSLKWAKRLLLPMLVFGLFSVGYWDYTESLGRGDLRLYAVVQFLPMVLIPIILLCFRGQFSLVSGYWYLILGYSAAKLLEHFDEEIFNVMGFMGGHPLKHVAAAVGIYYLLRAYERRGYA